MTLDFTEKERWLIDNCFKINEVIAIVYYGRSGSVFLQSLLDNHPQLLMFPGTALILYAHFWKDYSNLPKTDLLEKFCEYFASFFDVNADDQLGAWKCPAKMLGFDKMGEKQDEIVGVDRAVFLQVLDVILDNNITSKSFFQAIHVAYAIALGRVDAMDCSRLPIIIYQLHTPDVVARFSLLIKDFPKLKVMQMVREPLQTLGSHFKHHLLAENVLKSSYFHAFPHWPNEAIAVRLEDLHTNSHATMEKIAHWLNIDWNDNLLHSTFDGKKWWNVKGTDKISGFNKVIISKNHNDLYYKMDIFRLKTLFGKRYFIWGYDNKLPPFWKKIFVFFLLLFPFKIEMIGFKLQHEKNRIRAAKAILYSWGRMRKVFFKAWWYSLSSNIEELRVL